MALVSYCFAAGIMGVHVTYDSETDGICGTGREVYPHDNLDSAYVVVMVCADSTDTIESGYTDDYGWYDMNINDTLAYSRGPQLGYSPDGWWLISVEKDDYIKKMTTAFFTDSTANTIISIILKPEPECSTYTWSASIIDKRTMRPLQGAVATITQLQTSWFCGDSAAPWGAGAGGEWTVVSDSDGMMTTDVLRYSIIRVDIPAMGYTEVFEMDADKTAGKLYAAPRGGYRR